MTLADILDDPVRRAAFVADAKVVIDTEVARKTGLSGLALKGGYAAVQKVRPDIVEAALDVLLPRFAPAIEPRFQAAIASGDVAGWFAAHAEEVADALLAVTDERIEHAQSSIVAKTYRSLRGAARQHTIEAIPAVGRLLAAHVR